MSASRPQFSIDDAFELSLEDAGPGLEPSGVARFGPLHFERRARFEVADEDKQSRLRYQVNRPAHLTQPSPESGRTPGRTPENPNSRICLEASARAGDRPREVAAGPNSCPDPLRSDFSPQPLLESSHLGARPTPAGDPNLESPFILATDPPSPYPIGMGNSSVLEPNFVRTQKQP